MLDLLHNGVTLPPSAPLNPSLSSRRRSRDTGGKVSGIELLAYHDSRGAPVEKVVPGLFIQRDAQDSNFIDLNSAGATAAFCLREAL